MPKKPLLIDIDKYIDFSFIYDKVKEYYSDTKDEDDLLEIGKLMLVTPNYKPNNNLSKQQKKDNLLFCL